MPLLLLCVSSCILVSIITSVTILVLNNNTDTPKNPPADHTKPPRDTRPPSGTKPSDPGDSEWTLEKCDEEGYLMRIKDGNTGASLCTSGTFDTGIASKPDDKYIASNDANFNTKQCARAAECVDLVKAYARAHPFSAYDVPSKDDLRAWGKTVAKCARDRVSTCGDDTINKFYKKCNFDHVGDCCIEQATRECIDCNFYDTKITGTTRQTCKEKYI